jgi:uncharacterized membrane protein YqjE
MFRTVEKARLLGALALERVDEYLELVKISVEIQGQYLKRRLVHLLVVALFAVLALIFMGFALIVTFWDTPYRLMAAWGVAGGYALIAFLAFMSAPARPTAGSTFDTVRDELQEDIKLMKDVA